MINAPFKILISFLLIFGFVQSSLIVVGPESLKKSFDATNNKVNGIDYALLSSKSASTKTIFQGTLISPDPVDGCSNLVTSEQIEKNFNPVVIVSDGNCGILQKVRNAEIVGAKLLIYVLSKDSLEDIKEVARSFEYKSSIDTLIIGKNDGQRILDALANEEEVKVTGPPRIKYTPEYERNVNYMPQSNVVKVDYWFATSDKDEGSYVILEFLRDLKYDFGDSLIIKPHFVFWEDDYFRSGGYAKSNPQCLSNGRYCDPEPNDLTNVQGSASVLESLRQICLRDKILKDRDDSKWWSYVLKFGNECIKSDTTNRDTDECRKRVLKEVGLDGYEKEINDCMRTSFEMTKEGELEENSSDNLYLKKEFQDQRNSHVSHYPLVSANGIHYSGSIYNIDAIKVHICSGFTADKLPRACGGNTNEPTQGSFWMSFWTIIGCAVIMFALVYCVRRSVKRQVMSNMHHEISTIVSQYKKIGDLNDDNL